MPELTANTDSLGRILAGSPHPSAALARHSELTPVLAPGNDAAIVTSRRRSTVLVPLGPIGNSAGGAHLLSELTRDPGTRSVIVTQTRESDLPLMRALGFKSEIFGRNYSIYLPDFTDHGKPLAKVRQNVRRAAREGVSVREVPRGAQLSSVVSTVSANWIRQKGFYTKKLRLLVGEDTPVAAKTIRTFVAYQNRTAVAFVMYSAATAGSGSWLYDLTRRTADAPTGTIESINMHAIRTFVAEGHDWLHLGLTPFVGVNSSSMLKESRRLSWLMSFLAEHGEHLYPARTQERFKLKWNPHVIKPEFISVYPDVRAKSLYDLVKMVHIL